MPGIGQTMATPSLSISRNCVFPVSFCLLVSLNCISFLCSFGIKWRLIWTVNQTFSCDSKAWYDLCGWHIVTYQETMDHFCFLQFLVDTQALRREKIMYCWQNLSELDLLLTHSLRYRRITGGIWLHLIKCKEKLFLDHLRKLWWGWVLLGCKNCQNLIFYWPTLCRTVTLQEGFVSMKFVLRSSWKVRVGGWEGVTEGRRARHLLQSFYGRS